MHVNFSIFLHNFSVGLINLCTKFSILSKKHFLCIIFMENMLVKVEARKRDQTKRKICTKNERKRYFLLPFLVSIFPFFRSIFPAGNFLFRFFRFPPENRKCANLIPRFLEASRYQIVKKLGQTNS